MIQARMVIVRLFLLFFISALVLCGETLKLYLKDGNYHVVREYQVEGDRVRFYSVERSQWEEMPTELVDLAKTKKEHDEKQQESLKEAREQDQEEQAERALRGEIESIPMDTGAYYNVNGQVKQLEAASYQVITNKKRQTLKLLSPVPLIPGRASVVIQGEHAKFVVHDERPTFYFRPEKQERFGIVRVTPKKNARVVENVSIVPVSNESFEDRKQVEVFQQQIDGNLYKVWPEKPLEPGEYALMEFSDTGDAKDIELLVWDFAYEPGKR
ncbi:MAG: hypothetical protein JOZ62_22640 [Acidobacteriaceae bacterium]|nr:hypothetical protein [Acidobacteriaceae bacterium]